MAPCRTGIVALVFLSSRRGQRVHGAANFHQSSNSHTVHGASNFAERFAAKPAVRSPAALRSLAGSKRIHFVRHFEGEHNVADESGFLIPDAALTPKGEQDARLLSNDLAFRGEAGEAELPQLVVASPMRRTMQTAALGFGGTPC